MQHAVVISTFPPRDNLDGFCLKKIADFLRCKRGDLHAVYYMGSRGLLRRAIRFFKKLGLGRYTKRVLQA